MATHILTQERLKTLLHYDPDTGVFTYACARPKVRVGNIAGHTHARHGYRQIKIDGRVYLAHRLAWMYMYGDWPSSILDHVNRNRTDNRLINLRLSNLYLNRQNVDLQRNNTSGVRGVTWNTALQKWHARISSGGRRHHLGWFDSFESAKRARENAEINLHPHRPGAA
jgi:hypothetical protein